jgi:hypothetical protein
MWQFIYMAHALTLYFWATSSCPHGLVKNKLPLFLTKYHATKTYWEVEVWLDAGLQTALD